MDPQELVATVMDGPQMRNYTMRSGIERLRLGTWALEHVIKNSGLIGVRFRSIAEGEEASQLASFAVESETAGAPAQIEQAESGRVEQLEQRAVHDAAQEPDGEAILAAQRRAFMIQDLADRGVEVAPNKSDAFVESQHRILCADRGDAREAYLKRLRGR